MESTNLRRKDTTKGPPLRVLSLDGGGVRGYSMLILLQELMYKTFTETEGKAPKKDQIPKPCDYFDLIAGTGTGGLIAIMLGRLRLDLETCKQVYVRMTKRVFETDKTIAGIPYRSTLFKASKLEEAIQECVREHTIFENEGNDGTNKGGRESALNDFDKRKSIASTVGSSAAVASTYSPVSAQHVYASMRWGNPNASLYDSREERTKTAVTAAFKGTTRNEQVILLRSYDSRKDAPPEFNCSIWQAGRATSATGLAFKPIQIGHSMYHDEGAMNYNPAPMILDEAVVNEWPGRDLGVFVSIGTGKRPAGTGARQSEWWEGFVGGSMGNFAEARRRLIAKIEGCEETHQYMIREHLPKRGVPPENYYRLNVEVGVGEFGMNEWHRLADISTNTWRYMAKPDVKRISEEAAAKLGKIERVKRRQARAMNNDFPDFSSQQQQQGNGNDDDALLPSNPLAAELPGSEGQQGFTGIQSPAYTTHPAAADPSDKFSVVSPMDPNNNNNNPPPSAATSRFSTDDKFSVVLSPHDIPVAGDERYRPSSDYPRPLFDNQQHQRQHSSSSPRRSHESHHSSTTTTGRTEAPPLPPKTPLHVHEGRGGAQQQPPPMPPRHPLHYGTPPPPPTAPPPPQQQGQAQPPQIPPPRYPPPQLMQHHHQQQQQQHQHQPLPYPDDDGPPPVVNMAGKPEFMGR